MAVKANVLVKFDALEAKLTKMISRSNDMTAYFDTIVFRQYQNAQVQRFMTENSSEGPTWPALESGYAEGKKKRFSQFPGGGRRLLIATGALSNAALGRDPSSFRKIAESRRLTIGIDSIAVASKHYELMGQVVDGRKRKQTQKNRARAGSGYAQFVAEKRPFMSFGQATKAKIRQGIRAFIIKGTMPGGI